MAEEDFIDGAGAMYHESEHDCAECGQPCDCGEHEDKCCELCTDCITDYGDDDY